MLIVSRAAQNNMAGRLLHMSALMQQNNKTLMQQNDKTLILY